MEQWEESYWNSGGATGPIIPPKFRCCIPRREQRVLAWSIHPFCPGLSFFPRILATVKPAPHIWVLYLEHSCILIGYSRNGSRKRFSFRKNLVVWAVAPSCLNYLKTGVKISSRLGDAGWIFLRAHRMYSCAAKSTYWILNIHLYFQYRNVRAGSLFITAGSRTAPENWSADYASANVIK